MPRQEQESEQVVQIAPVAAEYKALITELKSKGEESLTTEEKELLKLNDKQIMRLEKFFLTSSTYLNQLYGLNDCVDVNRDLTQDKDKSKEKLKELLGVSVVPTGVTSFGVCVAAGVGALSASTLGGGVLLAVGGLTYVAVGVLGTAEAKDFFKLKKLIKRQEKIKVLVKKIQEQKARQQEQQSEQKERVQELVNTQRPSNVLSEGASARVGLATEQNASNVAQDQARNLSRSSSRSSIGL